MLIAIITLSIYWIIGLIITCINDDWSVYWACGLILPIALVILYPVRAWRTYTRSKGYYQKHGISRMQYIFGKRAKKER